MITLGGTSGHTPGTAIEELAFIRADANFDSGVDISDTVATLFALFTESFELLCDDAADSNDDGKVDISDATHTLGFLFLGAGPLAPFPTPGEDGTPDDGLRCAPQPRDGRFVIAVRPLRCPATGCDSWIDPPAAMDATGEDHARAIRACAEGLGASVRAISVVNRPGGDADHEAFELIVVVDDGAALATALLAADSRLILAPPGTISVALTPLQCGRTPWERTFGWATTLDDHVALLGRFLTSPGVTVISLKGEVVAGDEEAPVCDPACETRDCLLRRFRLEVVVSGDQAISSLLHYGWHCLSQRESSELRFPAGASFYRAPVWACDEAAPWLEWWVRENPGETIPLDADMVAAWASSVGAPLHYAWQLQTRQSVLWPPLCPSPDPVVSSIGTVWAIAPPDNGFLRNAGFWVVD